VSQQCRKLQLFLPAGCDKKFACNKLYKLFLKSEHKGKIRSILELIQTLGSSSQSSGDHRLPLLSATNTFTFPDTENHCPQTSTKLRGGSKSS